MSEPAKKDSDRSWLERLRRHWLVNAIVIVVLASGTTWGLFERVRGAPSDDRIRTLESQLSRATDRNATLEGRPTKDAYEDARVERDRFAEELRDRPTQGEFLALQTEKEELGKLVDQLRAIIKGRQAEVVILKRHLGDIKRHQASCTLTEVSAWRDSVVQFLKGSTLEGAEDLASSLAAMGYSDCDAFARDCVTRLQAFINAVD